MRLSIRNPSAFFHILHAVARYNNQDITFPELLDEIERWGFDPNGHNLLSSKRVLVCPIKTDKIEVTVDLIAWDNSNSPMYMG